MEQDILDWPTEWPDSEYGSEFWENDSREVDDLRTKVDQQRSAILWLVNDRQSMLTQLHGLQALRHFLKNSNENIQAASSPGDPIHAGQRLADDYHNMQICRASITGFSDDAQQADLENSQEVCSDGKSNLKSSVASSSKVKDLEELIENLRKVNRDLYNQCEKLQKIFSLQATCQDSLDLSSFKASQARLLKRTAKLERAFRIKDILCLSLAEELEGMKDKLSKAAQPDLYVAEQPVVTSQINCIMFSSEKSTSVNQHCTGQGGNHKEHALEAAEHLDKNNNSQTPGNCQMVCNQETCGEQRNAEMKSKCESLEKELEKAKSNVKTLSEQNAQLMREMDEMKTQHLQEQNEFRSQIQKLEQNMKQYQDMMGQMHAKDQAQQHDYKHYLYQVKEMVEQERQEKFAAVTEQKTLRQQVDSLTKSIKSFQFKNEENIKVRYEQEDQVEDFKRLKKLIQENGLPNIDQVIMLQRQNETYREDFLNERKEKERIQTQKDKIKRELDSTQQRISSLQEQIHKYRDHIYFLQQKFRTDTPPPAPPQPVNIFENSYSSIHPNKLYGPHAQAYVNTAILQTGVAQQKALAAAPALEKKPVKYGENQSKPWQLQQQGAFSKPALPRSLSFDSWSRQGQGQGPFNNQQQSQQQQFDFYYNKAPNQQQYQNRSPNASLKSSSSVGSLEDNNSPYYDQVPFSSVQSPLTPNSRSSASSLSSDRTSSSEDGQNVSASVGSDTWSRPQSYQQKQPLKRFASTSDATPSGGMRSPLNLDSWAQTQPFTPIPKTTWSDPAQYGDSSYTGASLQANHLWQSSSYPNDSNSFYQGGFGSRQGRNS